MPEASRCLRVNLAGSSRQTAPFSESRNRTSTFTTSAACVCVLSQAWCAAELTPTLLSSGCSHCLNNGALFHGGTHPQFSFRKTWTADFGKCPACLLLQNTPRCDSPGWSNVAGQPLPPYAYPGSFCCMVLLFIYPQHYNANTESVCSYYI